MAREYIANCILEEKEDMRARVPVFGLPEDLPSKSICCATLPTSYSGGYSISLCPEEKAEIGYLDLRGNHKILTDLFKVENALIHYLDLRNSQLDINIQLPAEMYSKETLVKVLDLRGSKVVDKFNILGNGDIDLVLLLEKGQYALRDKLALNRMRRKIINIHHSNQYYVVSLNEDDMEFKLSKAEGNEEHVYEHSQESYIQSIVEQLGLKEDDIVTVTDRSCKLAQIIPLFPEIDTNFNNWWNNTPYANKHAAVIAAITHRLGPSLNPRVVAMAANTPEDKIHTHEKKVAQWWETWLNHLLEHIDEYAEEADSSSND